MARKLAMPGQPRLAPISFRVTEHTRTRLEAMAAAEGRSLSQEVERIIDFHFTVLALAEALHAAPERPNG